MKNHGSDPISLSVGVSSAAETIFLSPDEVFFLRKVAESKEPPATQYQPALSSLREKLSNIELEGRGTADRILVEVSLPELEYLQQLTKDVYCFITEEERRARLVLREKMLVVGQRMASRSDGGEPTSPAPAARSR